MIYCTNKNALHHNSIDIIDIIDIFHVYFQPFPRTLVYAYDNILLGLTFAEELIEFSSVSDRRQNFDTGFVSTTVIWKGLMFHWPQGWRDYKYVLLFL